MPPSSENTKRVALAFPVAVPWMALCMQGIVDYARQHGGWNLLTSPSTFTGTHELALTADCLHGWSGDGVIAAISDHDEARSAERLDIPVVNLAATVHDLPFPRVMVDHYAIGRMAAEHLLQRGFQSLGVYGFEGPWYSAERQRGFEERAAEAGIPCEVLLQPTPTDTKMSWQERFAFLDTWLTSLTIPIGIFAVHDYRARILIDECNSLGLKVPQDVAVIGTDNDTTVCEHCHPALSSVARNPWENGYQAAAMLDVLMGGKTLERTEIVLPPEGVVQRGSTDTVAVLDPHVRTVVYFMRAHFQEPLDMDRLSELVPISRRLLEKRFLESLECTLHEYLCRLRVEQAQKLLLDPRRMKIHTVAKACGFSNQDHMRLVFLRIVGMTPKVYRDTAGKGI